MTAMRGRVSSQADSRIGSKDAQWPLEKKGASFLLSSKGNPYPEKKKKKGATHWATEVSKDDPQPISKMGRLFCHLTRPMAMAQWLTASKSILPSSMGLPLTSPRRQGATCHVTKLPLVPQQLKAKGSQPRGLGVAWGNAVGDVT